jgi:hypothetical protein
MAMIQHVHDRTTQEVSKARLIVRKYFGIPPGSNHGNGQVHLMKPFETHEKKFKEHFWEEDEPKKKGGLSGIFERIMWIRAGIGPVASCDMLDTAPQLYFKYSFFLFASKRTRMGVCAHEVTHSFQKDKGISKKTNDMDFIAGYSAHCAMEGLAVLAQKMIMKGIPEGFLQRMIEGAYRIVLIPLIYLVRPEALIKKIMTKLFIIWNSDKKEKLAEKLDSCPKLARWIWPYSSGIKFAEEITERVGPRVAFQLICDFPPSSMKEIIFPRIYLENTGKYVPNVEKRVSKELDKFHQMTGIFL